MVTQVKLTAQLQEAVIVSLPANVGMKEIPMCHGLIPIIEEGIALGHLTHSLNRAGY
jgi:hypothetical protein